MATRRNLTLEERARVRDAILDDLRHSRYVITDYAEMIADALTSNTVPGYLMDLIERSEP